MLQSEMAASESLGSIAQLCRRSPVGKKLPDALYVHISALPALDPQLQIYERKAREIASHINDFTLVKFSIAQPRISYLFYVDFDTDPHPVLQISLQVDVQNFEVKTRNYNRSSNPPILHRKEIFVTLDYPHYEKFAQLTCQEQKMGLLDQPSSIGTLKRWLQRLEMHGVTLQGHRVIHQQTCV